MVHVSLLCYVRILYPCEQQYLVGSHGGFSHLLGFSCVATAGVPAVIFSTSLMSFKFCACRLAMESVRVLFSMKCFLTVSFFWTTAFARLSREATICSPILVLVALLDWLFKSPPLVSF